MIREFLKRNQYIVDIYKKLHLHYRQVLSTISPTVASKVIYKKNFNRTLNLDNPQDFNEKLMWLKLNFYRNNPLVTQCADKYKAREYVKQCGYEEILNDLIGVWDSVDQIIGMSCLINLLLNVTMVQVIILSAMTKEIRH